jgi:hypothetical protein
MKKRTQHKTNHTRRMSKSDAGLVKKVQKADLAEMITPIATGVAVTAGVIAAGSMLAKKENRDKLAKGAKKGMDILSEISQGAMEEPVNRYQAIASQITRGNKKRGRKSKK